MLEKEAIQSFQETEDIPDKDKTVPCFQSSAHINFQQLAAPASQVHTIQMNYSHTAAIKMQKTQSNVSNRLQIIENLGQLGIRRDRELDERGKAYIWLSAN